MFVPTSFQASPAAMDLALRITNVIREFQQGRSDVTPRDVRMALRMAEVSMGSSYRSAPIAVMVAALAAAGLAFALLVAKDQGTARPQAPTFPFILLAIVVIVFLMLFVLRRR